MIFISPSSIFDLCIADIWQGSDREQRGGENRYE